MTSRLNISGPGLGLCLMVFTVGLSKVAAAQPGDAAGANTAGGSGDTTAPASNTAEPQAATPAPETRPAPSATQATKEPAVAKVPVEHEEAEPTPAGGGVPLAVEILPGSGYPEPKVRGLVGGSLWLTMPGYQFPYMAPETSKNQVRIAISGNAWVDTSYARINSGTPDTVSSQKRWVNQGRAVVRFTPAYTTREGWFVQGQVETVANGDQVLPNSNIVGGVDDLFVRAGKWNAFDVTVGRYQGWEVYHYGMGLDLNTFERRGAELPNLSPPQIYGVNYFWDRPNGGAGNYAAHFYPTDYLRFELLGQVGATSSGGNVRATRPVAILDLGYIKLKAGWEYGVAVGQKDVDKAHSRQNGFGGAIQVVIDPYIEGGVNAAIGYLDSWNAFGLPDTKGSSTTRTFGGFLNGRIFGSLMVGLGANQTHWNNLLPNGNAQTPNLHGDTDWATHFQSFAAIQYGLWDKLFFKFVANYARFHYEDIVQNPPHSYTNSEWGGRLRMMYLF